MWNLEKQSKSLTRRTEWHGAGPGLAGGRGDAGQGGYKFPVLRRVSSGIQYSAR